MEQPLKSRKTKSPEQALTALQYLCARGEKSSGDAFRLLRGWGVEGQQAEEVVAALLRDRFIDDRRYAEAYVREKSRLSGWGGYKIRQGLMRKGVARPLIEEALRQISPEEGADRLQELLERKLRGVKARDRYDLRTKLIRYALSRGYDFEQVGEQVDRLLKRKDLTCDTFFD